VYFTFSPQLCVDFEFKEFLVLVTQMICWLQMVLICALLLFSL
jgi:hypothetical protein